MNHPTIGHRPTPIIHPRPIPILGVPIHPITMTETVALVAEFMGQPGLHQLMTVNPEFIMAAHHDQTFWQVLQEADLCLADGVGLLAAGRWYGRPFPERVPGSELIYRLTEQCAQRGWRLFLLGAAPGVAEEAATIFQQHYPGLIIAGTYGGSPAPAENEAIVQHIQASRAEMLFVAYGAPQQDKWIARNRHNLSTVKVAMGIGGSLDFVTGRAIRAPRWLQNLGLEWLHRLYREPWRWRRMLALPRFVWAVLRSKP